MKKSEFKALQADIKAIKGINCKFIKVGRSAHINAGKAQDYEMTTEQAAQVIEVLEKHDMDTTHGKEMMANAIRLGFEIFYPQTFSMVNKAV